MGNDTVPATSAPQKAPHLIIEPSFTDPAAGTFVHKDYVRVAEPWAVEEHVAPFTASETFGDVESFCAYLSRHRADEPAPHITWNSQGLRAVLDYHERQKWVAFFPFILSPEWKQWAQLASGQAVGQRQLIEKLEDLGQYIDQPSQSELLGILRSLRATVNAKASTDLRDDGSTNVAWQQEKTIKGGGEAEIPSSFHVVMRALKGHVDNKGKPVLYGQIVRVRVAVGEDAHLNFRLSMPDSERVLEDVYEERVVQAKTILGENYPILRAAD